MLQNSEQSTATQRVLPIENIEHWYRHRPPATLETTSTVEDCVLLLQREHAEMLKNCIAQFWFFVGAIKFNHGFID